MDITVMVLSILLVICFILIWCQYEAKLSAKPVAPTLAKPKAKRKSAK